MDDASRWTLGVRISAVAGLIALLALFLSSSAVAQIVVGQTAPGASPPAECEEGSAFDEIQRQVAGGASYVVPTAGVLTSWSTNAAAGRTRPSP